MDYNSTFYDEANPDMEHEMLMRDIMSEQQSDNDEYSSVLDDDDDEEDAENSEDANSVTTVGDFDVETIEAELGETKKSKRGRKKKEDKPSETTDKKRHIVSPTLSERYFAKQLAFKYENYRDRFKFKYNGETFIGKVVTRLKDDRYIIDTVPYDNSTGKPVLRAFSIDEIKK